MDKVGIDDNYFALGGDSIRSIQVQSLAYSKGIIFSIQDLFRFQTIRKLAKVISNQKTISYQHDIEPFSLISEQDRVRLPPFIEDAYPLSMFQSSIIFQSEYDSEHILYQNIFSIHIRSLFLSEEFLLALRQLPTRHPTLRT